MTLTDARPFVISPDGVRAFSLPGDEATYESRVLVGPDGAGSQDLLVNHFTLRAGHDMSSHVHPDNDELYYVLRGAGVIELGGCGGKFEQARYEVGPNAAIFIPAGTFHRMENGGSADLEMLTIWPRLPKPGSNPIYDGRIETWGCSFLPASSKE